MREAGSLMLNALRINLIASSIYHPASTLRHLPSSIYHSASIMKHLYTLLLLLFIATGTAWGQTTINFDDAGKWTAGSAAIGSYASNHEYNDGIFSAIGGEGLRNGTATQDGFPGGLGTYSWRLRDNASVSWMVTIASGGVSTFSFKARRWDASPSPAFDYEYSTDGGTEWTLVGSINNTSLGGTSDWSTFGTTINSTNTNIKIRVRATGTTERIMIDDFSWTGYSVALPTITTGTADPVGTSTATVSGNVSSDGGAAITDRGVAYGTSTNPTISGSFLSTGGTTGDLSANLTGLSSETLYYARAYATNSVGTSYGSNVEFTTSAATGDIATTGTFSAFSSTYGTASTPAQSITVSGTDLSGDLTISVPDGFEVSLEENDNYGATKSLSPTEGDVSSTSVYVRLAASSTPGSYSGNVSVFGGGAEAETVSIPSSTVSAKALTIASAAVTTKTYDGTNAAVITGTLTGIINDDDVDFTGTGTFDSDNAGEDKDVTSTSSLTGDDAGNYTLTHPVSLTGTISPKAAEVTAEAKSKVAGAGDPTFTYTVDPALLGDDVFTGSLSREAGESVGVYAITIGNLENSNYTIDFVSANLSINPQAPTAEAATSITTTGFTANWGAVSGATGYRIDVTYETVGDYATDLFFSEYIEGSSNNKYIEIYNGTGATVDLTDYEVSIYANGSATSTSTQALSGTLAHGSVLVFRNSSANISGTTGYATSSVVNFNGDDALTLKKISTDSFIDYFGSVGHDPGSAWSGDGFSTVDKTLRRKSTVLSGLTSNPATTFPTLTTEWEQFDIDNVSGLGSHTSIAGETDVINLSGYNNADAGSGTSFAVTGASSGTEYTYVIRATNDALVSSNSNEIDVTTIGVYSVNLAGTQGWRLLSSPVSGSTYADLLGPIWTQGATGADATNGTPNVFWSEGSTTASLAQTNVTDLTVALTPGRGFAVLVYNDDNYTDEGGTTWPKTLSVTGTENAADVTYTPTWTSGTEYAIAGNPFASTIEWDALTTGEGVHDAVWVWNPGTSTYDAYNAGNGLLTGGLIAPFQGFWIQYNSAASGITFPAAAKTTGGTFRGKEVEQSRMVVRLSDDAGSNQAWIAFRDGATFGEDRYDAVKFSPMSGNYIQLYSVVDDKSHDINALPIGLTDALEIPLGYTSTRGGNVTLDLTELNLPEGWMVSIRDNVTNETLPVSADFSYTFESTRAKAAPASETPQVLAANDPRFTLIVDPLGTTSTKDDGRGTMDEFALHQNYPNPFNPSTQIRFTLQSSDVARLTVYDLLGREVAVLVNGTMPAGSHSIAFDASNLTSGVYIYKLEAGGHVMTKRMTLLK